jgi:membrane protease YdiL (CAAX protease family)
MADSSPDGSANPEAGASARWVERHAEHPLLRTPDLGTRGDTLLRVVAVLFGAIVVQTLVASFGLGLLAGVGVTEEGAPVAFFTAQAALGLFGFLLLGVAYLYVRDDPGLVGIQVPGGRDVVLVGVGFVALVGLQYVSGFAFEFFGVEPAENTIIDRGEANPELFLVLVPVQFLLTGPGEELLFRGVIQGLLCRTYGLVPGIGLAAGLFALVHVPSLIGGDVLPVLAVVFLSGVILGAIYEYTRNLLVPILAHALLNTFLFGIQYAEAVGALVAV